MQRYTMHVMKVARLITKYIIGDAIYEHLFGNV
jgi:hypothetical protein